MSALDDFMALLETTEVIKQVLSSLKEEPALLLGHINREFERSGESVPDHRLMLGGFLGEDSLKALVSAGLIQKEPGQYSVYRYQPTDKGKEYYEKLGESGFYRNYRAGEESA